MRINWKVRYDELLFKYRSACARLGKANEKLKRLEPQVSQIKIKDIAFNGEKLVVKWSGELETLREQCNDNYARWQQAERIIDDQKTIINKQDATISHLIAALHNIDYKNNV